MDQANPTVETPDLVLTAAAVDRLRELLDASGDTHRRLRIEAEGSPEQPAFSFGLAEHPASDDVELDFAAISVILDPVSRDLLRGHEVDHKNGGDGEYFVVRAAG